MGRSAATHSSRLSSGRWRFSTPSTKRCGLIADYEPPEAPATEVEPKAAIGTGWSEAPRGMLWHRYRLEDDGSIAEARIVPPTSQNQARIEQDLLEFVRPRVDLPDDRLQWECEQAIRNYDPCISCSTHFLKLDMRPG